MKIFLGAGHDCPDGFVLCRTAEEAIDRLRTGAVAMISLDQAIKASPVGHDVARAIEQFIQEGVIRRVPRWTVHHESPGRDGNLPNLPRSAGGGKHAISRGDFAEHRRRFAKLGVDKILGENVYKEFTTTCGDGNPLQCGVSLFFGGSQNKWVACCPEYWLIPVGRWAKQDKEEIQRNNNVVLEVIPSSDRVKLFAKWQAQLCPHPCEAWTEGVNNGADTQRQPPMGTGERNKR